MAIGQQMAGALGGSSGGGVSPVAPPPMPTTTVVGYFVGVGGKQAGPFDLNTLGDHVRDGSLTRQTLVWKPGMQAWQPAEGVDELKSLFASMPPPLPT